MGHDAYGQASQATKADDNVLGPVLLHLKEIAVIHHPADDILDVVGFVGIVGHETVQLLIGPIRRIICRQEGRILHVVLGQVAEQLADLVDTVLLVLSSKVSHAALRVVDHGAAQIFRRDFFVGHSLDHIWAGDVHKAGVLDHQDEIGHGRRVDGPASTGPHNGANLRNDARGQHVAQEHVGIGRQADHTFLDARSA